MEFPTKGTEVYLTTKNDAVYRGIFQWYKPDGGGRIQLQDVKICSKVDFSHWLVCPKKGMNRKFWVSKIKNIVPV